MKKLLLLSLLFPASLLCMENSKNPYKPKNACKDTPQIQYLLKAYSFAQAESEIHSIIAQELQKLNPDKWAARRQLNQVIKKYFNDFSQSEKNELMNAFSERWSHEYNRSLIDRHLVPKR